MEIFPRLGSLVTRRIYVEGIATRGPVGDNHYSLLTAGPVDCGIEKRVGSMNSIGAG